MNSESTLSDALSEVDTALAASDNERAAGLASELLLAYPNAVAVLRQRARALAAAGRSLQAAEVHRRVLEMLPADGEALAGLARTLHNAGQHLEARDAARQALDYLPNDEMLRRIAAGEGQPFDPDAVSLQFVKARTDALAGMMHRGAAGLRSVIAKSPERTDAKIVLMQALWRKGARIAAAEQAQTVLDEYPYCLNAHLLMLELWRDAGASNMERVHLQAIDQVDPDHRVTRAMLGTQSPLPVKDVPARPAQPTEPAAAEEDPLAREAWVDSLMAESSALPKPLEQLHLTDNESAGAAADEIAADAAAEIDEQSEFISSLLPLEWSAANDLSEESPQDDFSVSWIDGNVKDAFSPARPRAAEPDPRDGVPAELPPLEWEGAGEAGAAQPHTDHRTAVDGGIASRAAAPAVADESAQTDNPPLKPLAAAGIVAAAVKRSEDAPETGKAGAEAQDAQPLATVEQTSQAITQTAPPESAAQPSALETNAAQPASAQETPIAREETPASDVETAAAEEAPPAVAPDVAPTATVHVDVTTSSTPAPAVVAQADDASGVPVMKAVAAATAIGVASKKRKKKADAEVEAPTEMPPAAPETQAVTTDIAGEPAALAPAVEPAQPEAVQVDATIEAVAPAAVKSKAKKEPAGKAAKSKPAKKPAAKSTALETQTEKVRKAYERAIATAKREDMPKLIKELNQAAEHDPDNKIIFELLGQAYNRSGDIPAAIDAYRKALELGTKN